MSTMPALFSPWKKSRAEPSFHPTGFGQAFLVQQGGTGLWKDKQSGALRKAGKTQILSCRSVKSAESELFHSPKQSHQLKRLGQDRARSHGGETLPVFRLQYATQDNNGGSKPLAVAPQNSVE